MEQSQQPESQSRLVEALELLPMAWLILTGLAYLLLALQPQLFPELRRREAVPGVGELERFALPLLLAVLAGAIIRYFCLRGRTRRTTPRTTPPSAQLGEGADSP